MVLVGCGPSMSINDAAFEGDIEVVKQYLADGMDVNTVGDYGMTPLHSAAASNQKEIVELLISKGADVNAKDNGNGTTPLDLAIQQKKTETADLLRKHAGKTGEELEAEQK